MLHFLILIATALCVFTAATLSPIEDRQFQFGDIVPVGPEYYLQTKVISGDQSKDGLYLAAWHSGAAMNDAVLVSDLSAAAKGYYNNTDPTSPYQMFNLDETYPWGLTFQRYAGYFDWYQMSIDIGFGDSGYFINGSGLVSNETTGWAGWLACDWSRGIPQLFWTFPQIVSDTIPCSCAFVELCAVLV